MFMEIQAMKYKRSFINSDYRPFVNGSTFDNKSLVTRITDRIQDPLARNKMIMDIMAQAQLLNTALMF